ncbi:MAG: hypothetical protein M3R02_29540 [Chloroflexota bacterium]|nr:hypothetical protein [Chloroflexota bacterium]
MTERGDGRTVGGRTVRTPEKEQRILDALIERPSVAAACRRARIARSTYYLWRGDDPAFAARADAAIETGLDRIEDALVERAVKHDTTAAIFLLKTRRREVYGDRTEATVTHKGEVTHTYDLSGLSDDRLAQLKAARQQLDAVLSEVPA